MSTKRTLRITILLNAAASCFIMVILSVIIFFLSTARLQEAFLKLAAGQAHAAFSLLAQNTPDFTDEYLKVSLSDYFDGLSFRYLLADRDRLSISSEESLKGYGLVSYTEDGRTSLYGYAPLPGTTSVLLLRPAETSAVFSLFYVLTLTGACVLLFISTMLAEHALEKRITLPLHRLSKELKEQFSGDLKAVCLDPNSSSIDVLSGSLRLLASRLDTDSSTLKSMQNDLASSRNELKKSYDYMDFLARYDVLTDLPNKTCFYEKAYAALNSKHGAEHLHVFYFIDIDNFKTINDTLGHNYGDLLLASTAARLAHLAGSNDILARAGGDEFLFLKTGLAAAEEAAVFGETILKQFEKPFCLEHETAYITVSIGAAVYPAHGLTHTALIKNADIAMYHSKDSGRNKLTIFNKHMEDELNRSAEILDVLRHALENGEAYLVYQPLFCLRDNSILGYEALMRLDSKKLGAVPPSEFIPVAEANGLIYRLGLWALREACLMNCRLLKQGFSPRVVSVNLSSLQLRHSSFMKDLTGILTETGLPSNLLELELTESTLLASVSDAAALLESLCALGIRIALDDFGTGYSSLNYLTRLPISTLKIDKSFIDNIFINEKDACIAETIISLAHSLHITVVAEGVENPSQLSMLDEKHCDLIQGYLYSRPVLPEQLKILLAEKDGI